MLASTDGGLNEGIGGYLIQGGSPPNQPGGNPDTFTVFYDNILLATTPVLVPEPSTASLAGLAMTLALCLRSGRQRRRQRGTK